VRQVSFGELDSASVDQSRLLIRTSLPSSFRAEPAEAFLGGGGYICKVHGGVYALSPLGALLRRRLISHFAAAVEARGFQPVHLSAIAPARQHTPTGGQPPVFPLRSSFTPDWWLVSRSEESVWHVIRNVFSDHRQVCNAAVWAISREYRPAGGGRGYRRSIEYENLIAYLIRPGLTDETLVDALRELANVVLAPLQVGHTLAMQRLNETGEYHAHDIETSDDAGNPFRIAQICAFTPESLREAALLPDGPAGRGLQAVCLSVSINRLVYALATRLALDSKCMWPRRIAPFGCHLVPATSDIGSDAMRLARETQQEIGSDVLLDDRSVPPGRKMQDSDLIRAPLRLVLTSRGIRAGLIGCRTDDGAERQVPLATAIALGRSLAAERNVT
jgi:hypothetical protein